MVRIQEEMTKACRFLRPFELNGRPLSAVDQSQNVLDNTSRMWTLFSLCLRFITIIFFDLLCSQNLDKLYFSFYFSFNRNPAHWSRSTTEIWYDLE